MDHGADSKEAALDPQVPSGLIPKRNSTRHTGMNSQELSWFARSEGTLPQDQRFLRERTVTSGIPEGSQACSTLGAQLFTKPGHWYVLPRHASLGTPGWRRPAPSSEPKEKLLGGSDKLSIYHRGTLAFSRSSPGIVWITGKASTATSQLTLQHVESAQEGSRCIRHKDEGKKEAGWRKRRMETGMKEAPVLVSPL